MFREYLTPSRLQVLANRGTMRPPIPVGAMARANLAETPSRYFLRRGEVTMFEQGCSLTLRRQIRNGIFSVDLRTRHHQRIDARSVLP